MALINSLTIFSTNDGKVRIYQKSGQTINGKFYQSRNWYASIKLPRNIRTGKSQPLIRFSTGLSGFDAASIAAISEFWRLSERHRRNLPLKETKFSTVCTKFINKLRLERRFLRDQSKNHYTELSVNKKILIVERFLNPYFGEIGIEDIDDNTIGDFKDHRAEDVGGRNVRKQEIKTGTLNKTLTVLRQIFRFSVDQGFMHSAVVPIIPNKDVPKDEIVRNPEFSKAEYRKLVANARGSYVREKHSRVKNQKFILWHLILILANTGARMTELKNLRWNDIDIYEAKIPIKPKDTTDIATKFELKEFIKIQFYGKVSRSTQKQWSSPVQSVRVYLERLKEKQKQWAKQYGWAWTDECKVLTDYKGNEVSSFNKGFNALLKETDLMHKKVGDTEKGESIIKKRNLGGLRHYYAINMLGQHWDYFDLATNMRTSPEMLRKYYVNEVETNKIPLTLHMRRNQSS